LKAKVAEAQAIAESASDKAAQNGDMTPEEIKQKIQQADQDPSNIDFQKNLGMSLYLYAGMQKDVTLLPDAKRLMLRAYEKTPKDYNLLVALGNLNFDMGQSSKNDANLEEARRFYGQALEVKPKDIEIQTDIGSTYFLSNPPQYEKAIAEYRKSLLIDPAHERTLDNLTRTLIAMGKTAEAQESLAKIKKANASYQGLPELEKQLAEKK
jgi:tetratricopeptide (TPR) repeat protein